MDYESPTPQDLAEVRALNEEFLTLVAGHRDASAPADGLSPSLASRLAELDADAQRRLAAAPFLIFSLREYDDRYWDQVHSEGVACDLFTSRQAPSTDYGRLVAAALAFVWQLARRNPYTLRLICCASLYWCERLAERPLLHVINRTAGLDDLLALRAADNDALWDRLLRAGVVKDPVLREATHRSVLQMLLMMPPAQRQGAWRTAACQTRLPSRRRTQPD